MSKKSLKLWSTLLGATILLSACAGTGTKVEPLQQMKAAPLEWTTAPVVERHANQVQMLYFSPSNNVVLRRPDGTEQVLNDTSEVNIQRSLPALHSDGVGLYALWRPKLSKTVDGLGKTGDKFVFFRASLDAGRTFGPVQRLSNQGGAFKPEIASNGTGDLYVAYTDERKSGVSQQSIYMNISHDRGATWKKEDFEVTGAESGMSIDMSVVAEGNRVYVAWLTRDANAKFKVYVRVSEDRGETWLAPVAAHVSSDQPAFPALIKTASGMLLCWGQVEAVRCANSATHGQSWSESVAVDHSKGAVKLILAADAGGRAHMLLSMRGEMENAKPHLFHALAEDGRTFSKLQRLNGGAPITASVVIPTLSLGEDGSALAVWMDMRHYRPVIAANYSRDGGKTWLPQDFVMAGGKAVSRYYPALKYLTAGKYRVIWQNGGEPKTDPTTIEQLDYDPKTTAVVAMPVPDVARLKIRVNEFWQLREERNWAKLYDYLQPLMGEIVSRESYVASQGAVKYYSHRLVDEPQIDGNSATVPVAYDSEVPEMVLKGKKVSVPKQEVTIQHEWIWVDGDWYQLYRDVFGSSLLIQ